MNNSKTAKGIFYVMISVFIWAGWNIFSRQAVTGELTPYDVSMLRYGTAGILLLPFFIRKGAKIGPYGILGGLMLALLMGAPYNLFALIGLSYAPVSHATLINGSMMVYVTILGVALLKETLTKLNFAGLILSIIGIIFMFFKHSESYHPKEYFGHIMFVISAIMWGTYVILMKKWRPDNLQTVAVICVFSMVLYVPLYILFAPKKIMTASAGVVLFQGFYHGVINSLVAHFSYNKSIELLGAAKSSAFMPLILVIATLLAIPSLGETPDIFEWIGVIAIAVGVFLAAGGEELFSKRLKAKPAKILPAEY